MSAEVFCQVTVKTPMRPENGYSSEHECRYRAVAVLDGWLPVCGIHQRSLEAQGYRRTGRPSDRFS